MMTSIEDQFQSSPRSGRSKIAQRFIAGNSPPSPSAVREADGRGSTLSLMARKHSVARFTGLVSFLFSVPSTEVLGYFQSSATRTIKKFRLILSGLVLAVMLFSGVVKAQQPSPSPTPKKTTATTQPAAPEPGEDAGDYVIISTIEVGARGLRVGGDVN